jgi:hypothetical protein
VWPAVSMAPTFPSSPNPARGDLPRKMEKGCPYEQPFLSHRPQGPRRLVLAEITPRHHLQSQTCFEYRILKRHWITSLKLVEHEGSLRPFAGPVQSQNLHAATAWTCPSYPRGGDGMSSCSSFPPPTRGTDEVPGGETGCLRSLRRMRGCRPPAMWGKRGERAKTRLDYPATNPKRGPLEACARNPDRAKRLSPLHSTFFGAKAAFHRVPQGRAAIGAGRLMPWPFWALSAVE